MGLLEDAEYLNVGCGTLRYENCINMDTVKNPLIDADIVGNVLKIPFKEERFKGVIFSHVLEHLPRDKHMNALLEIWRVLKKDGTVYIEVPDLDLSIQAYLDNLKGLRDYWYQCIYGRDTYESDRHLSGITEQYLTDKLFECGFAHLKWIDIPKDQCLIGVKATKVELPPMRI
jgi:predicted SAM-dependent methyltransferase